MASIRRYTEEICRELLSMEQPNADKTYPAYTCPQCGNESVGIYAKVVKCKHEGCGFHIFREICGSYLSEDNIKDLLGKRRTPILKGLRSKAGNKFNARLILKEDCTTTFEFEQGKRKS